MKRDNLTGTAAQHITLHNPHQNEKILGIISLALSGLGVYLFDKIWGDHIDWEKFREI